MDCRIRIQIRNPDPATAKMASKVEKIDKFHVLKSQMFSLESLMHLLELQSPSLGV
jgi:hypothetical protein